MTRPFPYDLAFDRNLGWLTDWEQLALRGKRVAIAGMGGVGGTHLLTLARLGIGAFSIGDFDTFDYVNFNRQVGANVDTVGRPKVEVLEEMARAINPELDIRRFDQGISRENAEDFLDGVDLFIDGFDFFVLDIRRHVFARAQALGIPAITAAPIGFGAAYLVFLPGHMSFERYFRLDGHKPAEQYLRFLVGFTPRGLHRPYLVDPTRVDLPGQKGPSTVAACQICGGVTAAEAVKLLLRRGPVRAAPHHQHFDAYRQRFVVSRLPFGNAGPIQQLKLAIGRRLYGRHATMAPRPEPAATARTPVEEILNLARWAPSGDNAQPWRFEIVDDATIRVRIATDPSNVYEYRGGEPTWIAAGMMLETMRIAASGWQRTMTWQGVGPDDDTILVRFAVDDQLPRDGLFSAITLRSVDRRAYRRRALTAAEKTALEATLSTSLSLRWHEALGQRWRFARLAALSTDIRLRCPEAFAVHQRIIDWVNPLSATGIPVKTLPLDAMTRLLMRWAMRDWRRLNRLNRMSGTLLPTVQMDYLPILSSAAVFDVRLTDASPVGGHGRGALLRAGESLQRLWLTATRMGLGMQPLLAVVGLSHYGVTDTTFTQDHALLPKAKLLARSFDEVVGADTSDVVFLARIGDAPPRVQTHRSVRREPVELGLDAA